MPAAINPAGSFSVEAFVALDTFNVIAQGGMNANVGIIDLSDAAVQAKFTDDDIFKAVKVGRKDETGKVTMKPIEGMTDDEIKALVPLVRSLKK